MIVTNKTIEKHDEETREFLKDYNTIEYISDDLFCDLLECVPPYRVSDMGYIHGECVCCSYYIAVVEVSPGKYKKCLIDVNYFTTFSALKDELSKV